MSDTPFTPLSARYLDLLDSYIVTCYIWHHSRTKSKGATKFPKGWFIRTNFFDKTFARYQTFWICLWQSKYASVYTVKEVCSLPPTGIRRTLSSAVTFFFSRLSQGSFDQKWKYVTLKQRIISISLTEKLFQYAAMMFDERWWQLLSYFL